MTIIFNRVFMNKIVFALILLTLFTGCTLHEQTKNDPDSNQTAQFAVYLTDTDQMIFSEEDITSYEASAHTFTLTPQGAKKMKSYQTSPQINAGLYQKSFVVKLGEKEIYRGKFWTYLSSLSELGIIITDVVMIGPDYNTLTVAQGYPSTSSSLIVDRYLSENEYLQEISHPNDEINDPRIIEHFERINKLK